MKKKWRLSKPLSKKAETDLEAHPSFLRTLLYNRGIKKAKEAERYLNPSYENDLYDPFLILGMDKAVKRILSAIEKNEKTVIFADYDADGVPGAVILWSFFREVGYTNFEVYIPDRNTESYGLSVFAIEKFSEDVKLIITIDCGITSVDEVKLAKKRGIDVVITDHHLVQEKAPAALAIVDNKQTKDDYPFKMLCGAAVAFKLVQALMKKTDHQFKEGWDKWLLDLVAISTVSDMVAMEDENRILTHFGLKVLRRTKRLGLQALFKAMKVSQQYVSEDDIGFMLAPRLNSASRMDHANQSFYLLTTDNQVEADRLAKFLEGKNKERKEMVDMMYSSANKVFAQYETVPDVMVYGEDSFGTGGLGLASNRLKDKYGKVVFLWAAGVGDEVKGSCRSDGRVNMVELMEAAGGKDLFIDFGGHAMAAGFSLPKEKVSLLEPSLNAAYKKIGKIEFVEEIMIDREITLNDVCWENYYAVEKMSPFGMGNLKPVFLLNGVTIAAAKAFGNGGIHLELKFTKPDGSLIPAIGFFTCTPAEKFDAVDGHIYNGVSLEAGQKIDVLVNFEKSTFKNYPELRLRIVDLKQSA